MNRHPQKGDLDYKWGVVSPVPGARARQQAAITAEGMWPGSRGLFEDPGEGPPSHPPRLPPPASPRTTQSSFPGVTGHRAFKKKLCPAGTPRATRCTARAEKGELGAGIGRGNTAPMAPEGGLHGVTLVDGRQASLGQPWGGGGATCAVGCLPIAQG